MSDEEEECPECPAGIPAWVMTFADLMSLLMCFFVLLLSFSEMDVLKFKRLAGSMKQAFGVQNKLNVTDIPKGTSIIAQEFSPGRPEPTPINVIYQNTVSTTKNTLNVQCPEGTEASEGAETRSKQKQKIIEDLEKAVSTTENTAVDMAQKLKQFIKTGVLEIETEGKKIIIRIKEQAAFAPGSYKVSKELLPVLLKIADLLSTQKGQIIIEGHSDSVPYQGVESLSNWALSAQRAASVAYEMLWEGMLDKKRVKVVGFADTKPLVPNTSEENMARNRRVEIVLSQGEEEDELRERDAVVDDNPELYKSFIDNATEKFNLSPDEVF